MTQAYSQTDGHSQERMKVINELINLNSRENLSVLDIGAGECKLYDFIKAKINSYTAIDMDKEAFQKNKERYPEINLKVVDLEKGVLPFDNKSFSLVVASEVLEHITPVKSILTEIYRVLTPKGQVIITVPNAYIFTSRIKFLLGKKIQTTYFDKYQTHLHIFPISEFRKVLWNSGFIIAEEKPFNPRTGTLNTLDRIALKLKLRPTLFASHFAFLLKKKG